MKKRDKKGRFVAEQFKHILHGCETCSKMRKCIFRAEWKYLGEKTSEWITENCSEFFVATKYTLKRRNEKKLRLCVGEVLI